MPKQDLSIFKPPSGCVIANLPFTPEQREIFDEVMKESMDEYPSSYVLEVLQTEWKLSSARITALRMHRRKKCVCYMSKETHNDAI